MWLPTNDDTKTIQYDCKFLKSSPGRYPALKWSVTKIEDTAVEGISMFTMAQTQFDPARDNVELGIADYWESAVEPAQIVAEEITQPVNNLEITYSNLPVVKAGGGYKKFVLKERIADKLEDVADVLDWNVDFGGNESKLVIDKQGSILKVQCTNDYSLIGSTFTITAMTGHGSKSLVVEVASL